MGILRSKRDSLAVRLDMDTVFLHPASHQTGQPSEDPLLRGSVTLELTKPRRITSIRVQLKGSVTMHGGGDTKYETSTSLFKQLDLDLKGERLHRGIHTYMFAFIIPSTTAVQERSKFGTVRHTVRATCDGLGSFGTTLSSPNVPVWLIANPSPLGELPQGLETVVQDFGSEVGPIGFHLSSPHLTVASLLFFNVSFLSPPAMTVISVMGYVSQQFTVRYTDEKTGTVSPPPQHKVLFYVDQTTPESPSDEDLISRGNVGVGATIPLAYESRRLKPKPFAKIEANKPWTYSRIVRVPDDDNVRPTTLDATNTKIRVKHRIIAEIKYRLEGSKKDMVLAMGTDVTIASCCCLIDSLLLPSYIKSAPLSTPIRPFHRRCLCNSTLGQLVEKHGRQLELAENRPRRSRSTELPAKLGHASAYSRTPPAYAGLASPSSQTQLRSPYHISA